MLHFLEGAFKSAIDCQKVLVSEPLQRPIVFSDYAQLTGRRLPWFSEPLPSATALDFITMSAPSTRVDCGCLTTKAREEGAEHAHYRRGLSPELSGNCVFGSGHW